MTVREARQKLDKAIHDAIAVEGNFNTDDAIAPAIDDLVMAVAELSGARMMKLEQALFEIEGVTDGATGPLMEVDEIIKRCEIKVTGR